MNLQQWLRAHEDADWFERRAQLSRQAHQHLEAAVESGELVSLDGIRSPLSRRILEFHAAQTIQMNSSWVCTAQDWKCPCCKRSKFEISRVGQRGQVLAKLVVHHDHMGQAMEEAFHAAFKAAGTTTAQVEGMLLVERMGKAFAAFDDILVCEDCNNADTAAKRMVGEPPHF